MAEEAFLGMVCFDVSIRLIGVCVMLAENDQNLLAPQPWHELVVQVFPAAGKAGLSLASKKFITINRKIEIMGLWWSRIYINFEKISPAFR